MIKMKSLLKEDKKLSTAEQHQLKIAYRTLKMHPAIVSQMGGNVEDAIAVIKKLTGKSPVKEGENDGPKEFFEKNIFDGKQRQVKESSPK